MTKSIAALLILTGIVLTAGEAEAQQVIRRGSMQPTMTYSAAPILPATAATTNSRAYSSDYTRPGATSQPARAYSYSYYTLSPLPARTYVGYGMDEFPFHGTPYGHPYDPWTWPMMSGAYGNGLARYYDPPVK